MKGTLKGCDMTDLFEQIERHISGEETEVLNLQTAEGIKTVEVQSVNPARWIDRVYEGGRLMAIDVLAMILFCVQDTFINEEPRRRIVDSWAAELRKAASTGEIHARDPVTLLALQTLPDGWEWCLSRADADMFVAARGVSWKCSENFEKFGQTIELKRQAAKAEHKAQDTATPAPVVAAGASDVKPLQRAAAQDAAIICEIKKQGYDPLGLPANQPGKKGVKRAIREAIDGKGLFAGTTVFNKAWERLTSCGDIVIQG